MEYNQLINELTDFRNSRGWNKYHTLPALARAVGIEAGELNELFLWQMDDKDQFSEKQLHDMELELADILTYCYYMCDKLGVKRMTLFRKSLISTKSVIGNLIKSSRKVLAYGRFRIPNH
ncbi:nucleotide pyrophosphohydrolase [Lentilactobacillus parafarraginis]|uniref:nucleotide pyrophosphohydrolase n=1 Tax=Lentilactobacillus parafarraginis TaxID=390842 RepID=UPI001CDB0EF0|nr:nucleotide pyrophosphohydrolase [Lentilactobacillus parafarraginis]